MPRTLHSLPTDPTPVNERCLILFVPDDDAYLHAVMGQLGQLGQWYNWQRDNDHTAVAVAQHWRDVWSETLDLWSELEYDLCPLTINVNCGQSSSSGQCCTYPDITLNVNVMVPVDVYNEIVALPGGAADNGFESPMPSYPVYEDYQDKKCAYANQFAEDLLSTWDKISDIALAGSTLTYAEMAALVAGAGGTFFAGLVGAGVVLTGAGGALLAAFLALGTLGGPAVYRYFNDLLMEWEHDDIVCAIYGATDAEDARERLEGQISGFALAAGIDADFWGTSFMAWLSDWVLAMVPPQILEGAFGETDYIEELPDYSCALCQGVEPPPGVGMIEGLQNYWEFEEATGTRTDSHGTFDLVANGTVSANVSGVCDTAAYFTNAGILRTSAGVQLVGSGTDWSLGLWFRPELENVGPQYLVTWADNVSYPSLFSFGIYLTNLIPALAVNDGSAVNAYGTGGSPVTANAWHLAVLTYEDATRTFKLYVDDVDLRVTHVRPTAWPAYSARPLSFGGLANGAGRIYTYSGSIDESPFWTRLLSADDVDNLWNVGFGLCYENFTNPGGPA